MGAELDPAEASEDCSASRVSFRGSGPKGFQGGALSEAGSVCHFHFRIQFVGSHGG
jgi:hypothetical protein